MIDELKNKITISRQKKTDILIKKDIQEKLGDKLDKFNTKGMSIYGQSWEAATNMGTTIRDMVSIPEKEIRSLQVEAQNIVTQRKAEEESSLWNLWKSKKQTKEKEDDIEGNRLAAAVGKDSRESDVLTARASRGSALASSTSHNVNSNSIKDPRFTTKTNSSSGSSSSVPKIDLSKVSFPPRNVRHHHYSVSSNNAIFFHIYLFQFHLSIQPLSFF